MGFAPKPSVCETDALLELISYETCASGGVVIFWTTLCHTPPVLPEPGHTELQDFRRNARTKSFDISLTLSRHLGFYLPALACKSSNRRIALVPPLSLFGMSAVLGATVSGSLHRWPRLPVALQLPTQFIARAINLRGWVCMNDHASGAGV